jgi:Pyruvate/2-oxoacid:ferredoxin oxidoreductase gamma subunit
MAMVGSLLKIMNTVTLETVFQTMKKTFSPKLLKVIDINQEAMKKGFHAVRL